MKTLSPDIKNHLLNETTTLCRCWILENTNGDKLGFTDHDENLLVNGVVCERDAGMEASGIEERIGLNTNTSEVAGALQSEFITSEDIDAGKYDNAKILTYFVNWQDSSQYFLNQVSLVGEIVQEDHHYRMELRSYASQLDQTKGRHFIKRCQADLGDDQCRVSLDNPEFQAFAQIAEIKSDLILWVEGLETFESNWFRDGHITWTTGNNMGQKIEVSEHIKAENVTILHLWKPMPKTIEVDDSFTIQVGCNKEFATCQDKFSNTQNFRGFPHMPGNSFVTNFAGNEDVFDGEPIIK